MPDSQNFKWKAIKVPETPTLHAFSNVLFRSLSALNWFSDAWGALKETVLPLQGEAVRGSASCLPLSLCFSSNFANKP